MQDHLLLLILHEEVLEVLELDLEVVTLLIGYFLLCYIKHYQQDLVLQSPKVLVALLRLTYPKVLEVVNELLAFHLLLLVA